MRYAIAGIKTLILTEDNAKIHLLSATAVIISGFYFDLNTTEWCLVALSIRVLVLHTGLGVYTSLAYRLDVAS